MASAGKSKSLYDSKRLFCGCLESYLLTAFVMDESPVGLAKGRKGKRGESEAYYQLYEGYNFDRYVDNITRLMDREGNVGTGLALECLRFLLYMAEMDEYPDETLYRYMVALHKIFWWNFRRNEIPSDIEPWTDRLLENINRMAKGEQWGLISGGDRPIEREESKRSYGHMEGLESICTIMGLAVQMGNLVPSLKRIELENPSENTWADYDDFFAKYRADDSLTDRLKGLLNVTRLLFGRATSSPNRLAFSSLHNLNLSLMHVLMEGAGETETEKRLKNRLASLGEMVWGSKINDSFEYDEKE